MTKEQSAKLAYDALSKSVALIIHLHETEVFHKLLKIRTNFVKIQIRRNVIFLS